MKYLLIYNPVSGTNMNKTTRLGNAIFNLGEGDNTITVYKTREKGDGAKFLFENDISSYDAIIVCGGDGTLHEMVDGAIKAGFKGNIGYIPFGTTNDYAATLGIKSTNATKVILANSVRELDVGKFNDEHFNYVAAFGCFTEASYQAPQDIKNGIGYLAYILEAFNGLADIKPIHFKCKTDTQEIEDDILVGMVTNSLSVAGRKLNSKQAKLDDGLLEYIFIKFPTNVIDLQNTLMALLNNKFTDQYMYWGHSASFSIESDETEWNLDGEDGGKASKAEISVIPKALKIIASK